MSYLSVQTLLNESQQGIMVIASLNLLPHPEDLAEGNEFGETCCAKCCAPCSVLRELDRANKLDIVVESAPVHMWKDLAWRKDGKVNREWLYLATSGRECDDQH